MNFFTKKHLLILGSLFSLFAFGSCGNKHDEPDYDDNGPRKRSILLYAVASNNLSSNLVSDKNEILKAAKGMDLRGLSMLVYEVTRSADPQLLELKRINRDSVAFVKVKGYDKSLYSTDPRRISEVMGDVRALRPSDSYGLILWSHGTGFDPSFPTHGEDEASVRMGQNGDIVVSSDLPELYSFGMDNDPSKDPGYNDAIDIDELADAIPDHMFDFIWFDACYMSGIETIYELRDKCDYFVGYPTEVYTPGMAYDLTVPYLLREQPDLKGAAEVFFNYYAEHAQQVYRVATVAVVDMSQLETVADLCKGIYAGGIIPSVSGLQKYSRDSFGPFYDFGQYTSLMAESNKEHVSAEEIAESLSKLVIYKAATPSDFNFQPIVAENYSGISCFRLDSSDSSEKAEYYRTLDWYKRVYPGNAE